MILQECASTSLPPPRHQHQVIFSLLCPGCGVVQGTSPQTSVRRGLNYFCRILRATLLINSGCIARGKYTSSVIFLHTFAIGVQGRRTETPRWSFDGSYSLLAATTRIQFCFSIGGIFCRNCLVVSNMFVSDATVA